MIVIRTLVFVLFATGLLSCEKELPLSNFNFDYEPQIRIQGDFFVQNLEKSVVRIDSTFNIRDTIYIDAAIIRNASAELRLKDGSLLSTLSWNDSASSYPYYVEMPEFGDPNSPFGGNDDAEIDTFYYGGYTLDNLNFQLYDSLEYELRVELAGENYVTSFSPRPPAQFTNITPDSVGTVTTTRGSEYTVLYDTMAADTARLAWKEEEDAYFYTVSITDSQGRLGDIPQIFAFPGPEIPLPPLPGTYEVVIGAMNQTFYRHYYLNDLPANHETRNFFNGKALGYAGALNETYLEVTIISVQQE